MTDVHNTYPPTYCLSEYNFTAQDDVSSRRMLIHPDSINEARTKLAALGCKLEFCDDTIIVYADGEGSVDTDAVERIISETVLHPAGDNNNDR